MKLYKRILKFSKEHYLFLFLSLAFTACAISLQTPQQPVTDSVVKFTILHTNDSHGRFWKDGDNEYGLAARKTLIDGIRREVAAAGGQTLLLDAGDVNTGVPESDMQNAEPDFRGMSYLGYEAMAVGNHEFDKSAAIQHRQQTEWSSFPWLSANVYQGDSRKFEPYRIFDLGGLRLAVLGLTTEDTGNMLSGEKYPNVTFRRPADEAAKLVPYLHTQADVVLALTHMGYYTDGKHGVSAPGDVELAREVYGIDIIVGGHTHTAVCMERENVRNEAYEPGDDCMPDRQNGAWIMQASELGKFVGRADFEYRNGKLNLIKYRLIPVNLRKSVVNVNGAVGRSLYQAEIPEDEGTLALLRPYQQRGDAGLSAVVGMSNGKFIGDRAIVRNRSTNLGRLITASMIKKSGADFAVVSSGGIRDSLPEGKLTYRDLLKVEPFTNQVIVVSMRGDEVISYINALAKMTPGSGAFPQFLGIHFDAGEHSLEDMARHLTINGRLVDRATTYRMAINSFCANGGDGYPVLTAYPGFVNTGWVDVEVLAEYISQHGLLKIEDFVPEPYGKY